jgi:hypothetical protein
VGTEIDPDQAAHANTVSVALPFTNRAGQATLTASRSWTRPDGDTVTIQSNLLLVSLFAATP